MAGNINANIDEIKKHNFDQSAETIQGILNQFKCGQLQTDGIADKGVTGEKIADKAIVKEMIADEAITEEQLAESLRYGFSRIPTEGSYKTDDEGRTYLTLSKGFRATSRLCVFYNNNNCDIDYFLEQHASGSTRRIGFIERDGLGEIKLMRHNVYILLGWEVYLEDGLDSRLLVKHIPYLKTDEAYGTVEHYSTAPQKIGTWIDGTPVWRIAVNGTIAPEDIEWQDKMFSMSLGIKSNNDVRLLRESMWMTTEGDLLFTHKCQYESFGTWYMPNATPSGNWEYWGYVEFATEASNIQA